MDLVSTITKKLNNESDYVKKFFNEYVDLNEVDSISDLESIIDENIEDFVKEITPTDIDEMCDMMKEMDLFSKTLNDIEDIEDEDMSIWEMTIDEILYLLLSQELEDEVYSELNDFIEKIEK